MRTIYIWAEGEALEDDPVGAAGQTVVKDFGRTDTQFELVADTPVAAAQVYVDVALKSNPALRAERITTVTRRHVTA